MLTSCSLCSIDLHDLSDPELEMLAVLSLGVDFIDMLSVSSRV